MKTLMKCCRKCLFIRSTLFATLSLKNVYLKLAVLTCDLLILGAQWQSGRLRGREFEPHWGHCVMSLSKNINPSLVLVQPRKTRSFITERLLMGGKESNQTNKECKTGSRSGSILCWS